ncbi:MAG: hypothetical protein IJ688_09015 [Treponema sp.]|nr:hypothetical protein [Treponema sp.]
MQELRSTDVLDKEIQSEARRKADKILKKAKEDSEQILASVDSNIASLRAEREKKNQQRLESFEKNQKAAVPLEKARFEVSFIQEKLSEGVNEWLAAMTEEKRLNLLFKDYSHQKGTKVHAYIYGFDFKNAKKFVEKKIGQDLTSCEETVFGKIVVEETCGLEKPEGIIIEADDKSLRSCLTMSRVIGSLFDVNRKELAAALLGV